MDAQHLDFPKLTTDQATRLFKAMMNNWKMELDCMGFTAAERFELESVTKIYRESLREYEGLLDEVTRIIK